jgi:hypothetical protein
VPSLHLLYLALVPLLSTRISVLNHSRVRWTRASLHVSFEESPAFNPFTSPPFRCTVHLRIPPCSLPAIPSSLVPNCPYSAQLLPDMEGRITAALLALPSCSICAGGCFQPSADRTCSHTVSAPNVASTSKLSATGGQGTGC